MLDVLLRVASWPSTHKIKAPTIKAVALQVLQPLDDVPAHPVLQSSVIECTVDVDVSVWASLKAPKTCGQEFATAFALHFKGTPSKPVHCHSSSAAHKTYTRNAPVCDRCWGRLRTHLPAWGCLCLRKLGCCCTQLRHPKPSCLPSRCSIFHQAPVCVRACVCIAFVSSTV